jgi:hypothetical protein
MSTTNGVGRMLRTKELQARRNETITKLAKLPAPPWMGTGYQPEPSRFASDTGPPGYPGNPGDPVQTSLTISSLLPNHHNERFDRTRGVEG